MTAKYSTKKALIASALMLVFCLSSLLGTTFAWFTDSATSANNIISTGNLKVGMYWADGTEAVPADVNDWTEASSGAMFDYENWEPGFAQVRHVKIANEGTLALKYNVSILANGEVTDLADVIDVYYVDPAVQVATAAELTEDRKLGTLTEVLGNLGTTGNGTLAVGEEDTITIALKMQENAGNDYMNKSIGSTFSIQLVATQLNYEDDSFGKDYDEDAVYPDIASGVYGGGETLVAGNVAVTLPEGAVDAVYELKVDNKLVETNANHETTLSLNINLAKNGQGITPEAGVTYNVAINVGESLVLTNLTHNGTAITDYSYDPTTGIVTFKTDSFSPFTVSYSENVIKVRTAEELIAALDEIKTDAKQKIPGETGNKAYRVNAIFVLEADIVIDADTEFMYTDSNGAPLHFYGVRGILDFNGHTITVTNDALLSGKAYANATLLIQYSNLDIIGEGGIVANNKSIPVYGWANSTVNIYDGNYVTNAYERNESAVYVNNASVMINVYGGTYTDSKYAFNVHDNCGTTTTIVLHEGIVYEDFLKSGTVDLIGSDISNGRIVLADGCELNEYEENGVAMNKVVFATDDAE